VVLKIGDTMDIHNGLLEDRHFLLQALAGLVSVEQDRIVRGGLVSESQLKSLADVTEYMVSWARKNPKDNIPLNTLANLSSILKEIKFPGDFEKYTIGSQSKLGEEFWVALELPFQGEGFDEYLRRLRAAFTKVQSRKPKASRPRSREVYLVGRGFKGAA